MIDFLAFEQTPSGYSPDSVLDIHPTGNYLAMQAGPGPEGMVWDIQSKHIVWQPEEISALAWLHHGTQIATFSDNEFTIYAWPERNVLSRCPVSLPGWAFGLTISPAHDFAICHWIDQTEAGFVYVDITEQGVSQDLKTHYFLAGTNMLTRAVFSPDETFWICAYEKGESWWASADVDDGEPIAPDEVFTVGELLIFQGKSISQTIPMTLTLPRDWLPPDAGPVDFDILSDPVFLDTQHIQITLPYGYTRTYEIPTSP